MRMTRPGAREGIASRSGMEQEEVGVDTDWSLPTLGVRSLSANVGYC